MTGTQDPRTHPADGNDWTRRLHGLLDVPPTEGNEVRVLRNGIEIFPAMLDAIDADEWNGHARTEHEWRDTHLAIRGPAVAGLQAGFIDNWADKNDDGFDPAAEAPADPTERGSTTCTVIRGSAETGASEIWRLALALVTCATRRVRIASAYFNPDERLCAALVAAAARGVEVDIRSYETSMGRP